MGMRTPLHSIILFIVAGMLTVAAGCTSVSVERQLRAAEAVMVIRPDSALVLLQAIPPRRAFGRTARTPRPAPFAGLRQKLHRHCPRFAHRHSLRFLLRSLGTRPLPHSGILLQGQRGL